MIQRLSVILFLIVFIAIWVEEWDRIVSFITRAGLIAFILKHYNDFRWLFCCKNSLPQVLPKEKCVSLECGLQNGTLAVLYLHNCLMILYLWFLQQHML